MHVHYTHTHTDEDDSIERVREANCGGNKENIFNICFSKHFRKAKKLQYATNLYNIQAHDGNVLVEQAS